MTGNPVTDLSGWQGAPRPVAKPLEGRYARLEPLSRARHCDDLYASARAEAERFRYLPDQMPADRASFDAWLDKAEQSADPIFYAVIDKASGAIIGSSRFQNHDPADGGSVEIGWTFLARSHWGGSYNAEMKRLMLAHALQSV